MSTIKMNVLDLLDRLMKNDIPNQAEIIVQIGDFQYNITDLFVQDEKVFVEFGGLRPLVREEIDYND